MSKSHHDQWVMAREMRSWPSPEGETRAVPGAAVERVTHLIPACDRDSCSSQCPAGQEPSTALAVCCCASLDSRDDLLVCCSKILRDKFVGCGELWEAKKISACIKVTPTMPN